MTANTTTSDPVPVNGFNGVCGIRGASGFLAVGNRLAPPRPPPHTTHTHTRTPSMLIYLYARFIT